MQLEKKYINFDIKQSDINLEKGIVYGIASTSDIDLDGDIILPNAFADSINNWQQNQTSIKALYQHDNQKIIGKIIELSYESGMLKVAMQLYTKSYNGEDVEVEYADEVFFLAKEGQLSFSVGFYKSKCRYETKDNGDMIRYIETATLYEISLVSFPANQNAVVIGTKSKLEKFVLKLKEPELLEMINNLKSFEDYQILCEDYLDMPRNIRHAFKAFLKQHIKNEVEKQTIQQPAQEFQKASDTSKPAPSDTNEVIDKKSIENIKALFQI